MRSNINTCGARRAGTGKSSHVFLLQQIMGNGYVYSVVAFSAIGGLLFGYDQGVISGLLTMKYFGDYFGDQPDNPTSPFSANLQASIVDALVAGCFFGALGASWTGDYFGRKYTILGGAVTFMVGSIIQATAVNLGMLLAGRVIAGLAVGMLSMICPLYQSEIAPKEIRGRLISMQQWAVTWGIMVSDCKRHALLNASYRGGRSCCINFMLARFLSGLTMVQTTLTAITRGKFLWVCRLCLLVFLPLVWCLCPSHPVGLRRRRSRKMMRQACSALWTH